MARIRKAYYDKREMNYLLDVSEKQHYVFMPNEIFSDLREAFEKEEFIGRTSTHIAYAYAYYYLANYQWRYARYRAYNEETGMETQINEGIIKQILGFPAKSEQYTYLTKNKTGLLQSIGYIRKVTDKPSRYWYDNNGAHKEVNFIYESEYSDESLYGNNKNWKVAMPVKGFWRDEESELENLENGTFFEIWNTHMIDIDIFIYCMTNRELGVEGFYLYCFLKYMNDKFKDGYDCSNIKMSQLTGLSIDEVKSQLKNLEYYNMITNDHKPYCLNKPKDNQTFANTYTVKEYSDFAKNLIQCNVIPKQKKISAEKYEKEYGWANEKEIDGNVVNIWTGEIVRSKKEAIDDIDDDLEELFEK